MQETESVRSVILSKLENPRIYLSLGSRTPMKEIMTGLWAHWLEGVKKDFIPLHLAKDTVCITQSMLDSEKGRPSTLDVFKPVYLILQFFLRSTSFT